jgi:hypothetical protein
LAHVNSDWLYRGDEKYQGLMIENDLTICFTDRSDVCQNSLIRIFASRGETRHPAESVCSIG